MTLFFLFRIPHLSPTHTLPSIYSESDFIQSQTSQRRSGLLTNTPIQSAINEKVHSRKLLIDLNDLNESNAKLANFPANTKKTLHSFPQILASNERLPGLLQFPSILIATNPASTRNRASESWPKSVFSPWIRTNPPPLPSRDSSAFPGYRSCDGNLHGCPW